MKRLSCLSAITLVAMSAYTEGASAGEADQDFQNRAFVTQVGEAQRATIEQRNISGGLLYGSIQQSGISNNATISLEGGDLSGSIIQSGSGNEAALEIRDEHNRGAIEQYGDGNSAGLRIDGYGKDVTLIQEGNGHAYAVPIKIGGDAPAGQMITIRQY